MPARQREAERPGPAQTARLPRLRQQAVKPNFNRRAQEIIAAHMYEEPPRAGDAGGASPLLQLIDGTAPRTARSHDVSHLQDGSGALRPQVPPSLMAKSDYVYEPSFLPTDATSVYSDRDGMWHTLVFPSDQPSSRADAVHLDAWITRSLAQGEGQEPRPRSVEEVVETLSVAIREVSRQVTHHCPERGKALDRIWRTYVELFNRVMSSMQGLVAAQRRQTARAQGRLVGLREELRELRKAHPEDMHRVISGLEEGFSHEQKLLEERLKTAQEEGTRLKHELRAQHREIDAWFPSFGAYKDSLLRHQLSFLGRHSEARKRSVDEISPDVAIAEDFKRLLSTIGPEKRIEMGQELASVIEVVAQSPGAKERAVEPKGGAKSSQARAKESRALHALQEEIRGQEERIRQLRKEILAEEAAGDSSSAAREAAAGTGGAARVRGGGAEDRRGRGAAADSGSESSPSPRSDAPAGAARASALLAKGLGAAEAMAAAEGLQRLALGAAGSDSDAGADGAADSEVDA